MLIRFKLVRDVFGLSPCIGNLNWWLDALGLPGSCGNADDGFFANGLSTEVPAFDNG